MRVLQVLVFFFSKNWQKLNSRKFLQEANVHPGNISADAVLPLK